MSSVSVTGWCCCCALVDTGRGQRPSGRTCSWAGRSFALRCRLASLTTSMCFLFLAPPIWAIADGVENAILCIYLPAIDQIKTTGILILDPHLRVGSHNFKLPTHPSEHWAKMAQDRAKRRGVRCKGPRPVANGDADPAAAADLRDHGSRSVCRLGLDPITFLKVPGEAERWPCDRLVHRHRPSGHSQ